MILENTEFLQRPEILVRNELRRKVRHEYFFKNLLNNHWQVVEIREDFLKLCFSKGLGRIFALNRMHIINTVSDRPHLNSLPLHAQVPWLTWSNSSIF